MQYAAKAPGLRTGAVDLLDGSGNIIATGFVYGTGMAPLAAFSPALASPVQMGLLSPALSAPSNPTWRADGNLFFTDGTSTITNSAFSLGAGTTCPQLTTSSSAPGTLAPLANCTLTFNFQPTATGLTGDNVSYTNETA